MKPSAEKPLADTEFDAALAALGNRFTIDQLLTRLGRGRAAAWKERIHTRLESDERFFVDNDGHCRNREDFFTGRSFAVTPDSWEIDQKILVPGHRFSAFVSSAVFPSELTLRWHGAELGRRELRAPLGQLFHYHHLLGSDEIFDFFAAESPENDGLRSRVRATDPVTITVFELDPLPELEPGDALIATVADYQKGIIDLERKNGSARSARARKAWIAAFDEALTRVCHEFGDYPDLGEQLSLGLWFGGDALAEPAASFDEFIVESEKIEIRADGDHAVLSICGENEDEEEPLPFDFRNGKEHDDDHCGCGHDHRHDDDDGTELLRLSRGETADPAAMLREIGSSLTPVELDSMILDLCHQKIRDFSAFESRAFGRGEPHFADEAQRTVFQNFLEERFEELTENYNPGDDEEKGPLRAAILELVDDRLELFDYMASRDADLPDDAKKVLRRIAEVALRCENLLRLLNDPGFTPGAQELEKIDNAIGGCAETFDEMTEKLHHILEGASENEK